MFLFSFIFIQASLTLDESNINVTNVGDISADDNAVDLQIKSDDEQTETGLSNNANERIPILDDDDDVIVLPQEEPIITEIPDDDDNEIKNLTKECSNSQDEQSGKTSGAIITSQDAGISTEIDNEKSVNAPNSDEGLF